jgi:hypothetical protein
MTRSTILAAASRCSLTTLILFLLALSAGPSRAGDVRCGGDARHEAQVARTFLGYACREAECAAHKAGFAWADRHGVTDAAACVDAEDVAFGEGCRAFTELAATAEQSGFEWARANALPDDCSCDGAGPRFAAGCEAFVRAFGR